MNFSNMKNNLHFFSDEELCSLISNDNEQAFTELVSRYNSLISLKISSFSRYNLDEDDLFQEAILGLLSAANTYNPQKGAAFKTYASICIERKIINFCKSSLNLKNAENNNLLSYDENETAQVSNSCQIKSPEDFVIDIENLKGKKEKIKKLLSCLEYNVLSLHLSGHNYNEIAEKLSINAKCVDNALQRIRKKLTVLKKV